MSSADRTGLILEFAQRARTTRRLSCKWSLPQLQHTSTRLIVGWDHLRAPEGRDRHAWSGWNSTWNRSSLVTRAYQQSKKDEKVDSTADQNRRSRDRSSVPNGFFELVKPTQVVYIFNRRTGAEVCADQRLPHLIPTLKTLGDVEQIGSIVFGGLPSGF